jgi:hypothetical protein
MDANELKNYERLTRVRDFGAAHASTFATASLGGQLFAELNAAVAELTAQAATQVAGFSTSREGTTSKASARAALREHLTVINRTARAMAVDQPAIAEKFRRPSGSGDQVLLNAARAFLTNATPLAAEFIKHELPDDFLAELEADINELEQAISAKHHNTESHVSATAAIDSALERGLNALRKLDAIVRNKFHNDPAILAAWESASHAQHHARKPAPAPPPPPPKEPGKIDS